jgi:hypothetical protein
MNYIGANGQVNRRAVQAENFFGHSPVGSRPRVGVVPAREARVGKGKQFTNTLASLGGRGLNAVTPQSLRAERNFRRMLESFSRDCGEMLGALSHTDARPRDYFKANDVYQDMLDGCGREDLGDQLLTPRIAHNVAQMTVPELVALYDGLPEGNGYLPRPLTTAVENCVTSELNLRFNQCAARGTIAAVIAELHGRPDGWWEPIFKNMHTATLISIRGCADVQLQRMTLARLRDRDKGLHKYINEILVLDPKKFGPVTDRNNLSPQKALTVAQYLEAHIALRDEPRAQGSPKFEPHFVYGLLGVLRRAIDHNLVFAELDQDDREKLHAALNKVDAMQGTLDSLMSQTFFELELEMSAKPESSMPVRVEDEAGGT